jgi:hypothetical protein
MHYKFIDLPNLEEIQTIILRNLPQQYKESHMYMTRPVEDFSACTPLVNAVETFKPWDELLSIGIVITQPHKKIPVHTDLGDLVIKYKYSCNIPIYNCNKPYTSFYRLLDGGEPKIVTQPHGDMLTLYSDDQIEEIARMHLYKPAIFNTQVPHGITNPTDEPRIVISIRFKTPIDISEIP